MTRSDIGSLSVLFACLPLFGTILLFEPALAQNVFSDSEPFSATLKCGKAEVTFARQDSMGPVLKILTNTKNKSQSRAMPKACYSKMWCATYKNRPTVVFAEAPACGGNAVPETYHLFDVQNLRHTEMDYPSSLVIQAN